MARLITIMARLRDPVSGCPWDIAQDFASIAPYTIEEAYEVADVIERKAWDELADELGDLLLQVVYHARMAEEAGWFAFDAVADAISDKMIRRHPHVFGEDTAPRTADQQVHAWEAQKATERADRAMSVLDNVPVGLPALTRAVKLQRRAARVGFDWPDKRQVLDKIIEEAAELATEIGGDADRVEDEYADLLFAVVNLGRHLDVDPEKALRRVNAKFTRRFQAIEMALAAQGRKPEDATLDEMEALWQQAKRTT
jgi:ATP diphosphatase